ncbi:MAG TPA: SH3 domain-containing protein [Chloroflexota bacterium]|nr:SH3 domain-containing protein [Chloroflexota bacterium]
MRRALPLLLAAALLPGCAGDRHDFAITPRVFATASPTEEPPPTRAPRPPPTPTRTPLPGQLWVANAGREGVVLRSAPGAGDRLAGLADGTALAPQGEQEQQSGRSWLRVRDPQGRTGWIAAEFVSATPPARPGAPTATPRPRPANTPQP